MSDLRQTLADQVAVVGWRHLAPHHEREALLWVDDALDLVDVGVALARDDTHAVAGWLQTGLLRRTSAADGARWDASGGVLRCLIVRPWVLVSETSAAEDP